MRTVDCRHCGTTVGVASCRDCGREFALTVAHAEGRPRAFGDQPLEGSRAPAGAVRCDYCDGRARGDRPTTLVAAGLRQRTCPACHTEFLSA